MGRNGDPVECFHREPMRAIRSILADMMAVSKFSGLECRMVEIEAQLRARVDDAIKSRQPVELSSRLVGD